MGAGDSCQPTPSCRVIVHHDLLCSAHTCITWSWGGHPGLAWSLAVPLLAGLAAEGMSMRTVQFPCRHSCSPTSQSRDTSLCCVLLVLTTKSENLVLFIFVDADHCLPVEPTSAALDSVQHSWMSFTKAPGDPSHC